MRNMKTQDQNKTQVAYEHGFDLEDRCRTFAKRCRQFSKSLPQTVENIEDRKQLTRASGSVGANYIEANEAISKKDFVHRIKISRKESRETHYWLDLIDCGEGKDLERPKAKLKNEALELMKIFGAIYQKSK
mgnify:CR=1 FL=1